MRQLRPLALPLMAALFTASCSDTLAIDSDSGVSIPSASLLHDIGEPSGITLEPLARSAFPHPIAAKIQYKLHRTTQVVHLPHVSDVIAAKLTIAEGGSAGWHTHPGSAIGLVQSGTFGVIESHDCLLRRYEAGDAFFHPGQSIADVDVGFNAGEGDLVVYVTFLGIPAGQPPTIPADEPGC